MIIHKHKNLYIKKNYFKDTIKQFVFKAMNGTTASKGKLLQNGTFNGHAKANGYSSKQAADYYATGEGLTRPDLVQRQVTKSN